MTKQSVAAKAKDLLGLIIAAASVLALLTAVTPFETRAKHEADLKSVRDSLGSTQQDIRDIKKTLTQSACLQLAELQKTPWQACL